MLDDSDGFSSNDFDDTALQDNFGVLVLLPSLAAGLFTLKPRIDVLQNLIEEENSFLQTIDGSSDVEIQAIREQAVHINLNNENHSAGETSLCIDAEKSLGLSLLFGDTYGRALEVLSLPSNVDVMVFSRSGQEPRDLQEMGAKYLAGDFDGLFKQEETSPEDYIITVRVTQQRRTEMDHRRKVSLKKAAKIRKELIQLELEEILHRAKVSQREMQQSIGSFQHMHEIDKRRSELESELNSGFSLSQVSHVVDLKTWYCTCTEYQMCYTRSFTSDHTEEQELDPASHSLPTATQVSPYTKGLKMVAANELIKGEPNCVSKFFTGMKNKNTTKHLQQLPICCHLLAVVLVSANMNQHSKLHSVSFHTNIKTVLT
ncbi:Piso0_001479 [Millerozyma farinosa CBS 7064]|uniref:Piso0_001479 protein n=1 Tax=Pichia sorbitophila (strain ATCC MYA-4447 / BCRC 22081 / CBS 7064 / NBRC 10061 / NRRL Y-12695) TaxID=559304 RepID=G8YKW8_PICSO|nr:Piso0_001479 [Millerozyma farinosa CBS 7064]